MSCLGLLTGSANARWAEFSYSNLPGDTLSAEFALDSASLDSLVDLIGPIYSMEFGFTWNPQDISLDTIIFGGIASASGWGNLVYSVDTVVGKCLMAGAGVNEISQHGRIFTAIFNYISPTVWDPARNWLSLFKERYNESSEVGEKPPLAPTQFTLKQNYPNPFNPTTTIQFHLAQAGTATLSIYNLLGQVVKSVSFGRIVAGEHFYVWDGRDDRNEPVSSGVYLYKLETVHGSQTRKMVLTK